MVNDQNAEEDEIFELYLTGATGVVFAPHERTSVIITNEDHGENRISHLLMSTMSL